MTEPRTLKRLLLAALALLLAWQAQSRLSGPLISDGAILYGIAIVLFVAAFARLPAAQLARGQLGDTSQTQTTLPYPQVMLLTLAMLCSLVSFILFTNPANQPTAWLFHIASILVFLSAFLSFNVQTFKRSNVQTSIFPNSNRGRTSLGFGIMPHATSAWGEDLGFVLFVVALATFARLWQIDQFPVGTWYDEAFNGLGAAQMLKDAAYRPIFIEGDTLPAHFTYLIALSFQLFGVSTISMRFVTAAFGIVTVVFAYLLFRRWFGARSGLVAAALFAVMRYDLTFSRIALHGVTTPAFELAVLYFFDRALERKRLADVALTALTLGLGLAFYAPFRLFPFVLVVFVGALLIGIVRLRATADHGQQTAVLRVPSPVMGLTVALVFAIGLFIATAPIVQFATQHRDEFFARTTTVSIFEKRDEPDIVKALWSNFTKHMLMFNVLGDRNGRHNLPNEPMLDPLMGTLAVLGFAYALWRWRDPANALMLLLFFIMNLGGILTVDFEAPQSLRSIGVMPALVYFATLPFALIAQELARVLRRPSSNVQPPTPSGAGRTASNLHFGLSDGSTALTAGLGFALVLAAIALSNFDTFFNKQKNSPEVWAAHSVAETIVAQQMQRLAPNNDLIVTALFANHPVLRFLAPDVTNYQQWTVNDRLPLARDASRGVAMLFDPLLAATFDAAQRYYPTASFGTFPPPTGGAPVVYEVVLAPKDLRAVQGLVARYFAGNNFEGAPIREEAIAALNVDWTQTQPVSGAFAAEFRGALYVATYGEYQLRVSGSPTATLFVDENSVSDAPMTLAKGNHALRARVNGSATKVALQWQPPGTTQWQPVPPTVLYRAPVTNSGLLGAYYQSANWSGAPAFTQVDPEIALYFHNIPLPRPYSIEWKGKLFAPTAGVYRFATESIDNSQVAINSQIIVNNRGSTTAEGSIQLPQGWNDIGVRFADTTSHTHIYFYWTPPNGAREIVPSRYLSPPMGEYPSATEIAALPKPLPLPSQPIDPASQQPTNQPTPPPASNFTLRAVQTFGQHGSAPLQFNEPRAVAIDAQDHIVVADTGNRRVQILDSNGGFVQIIEGGEEKFVEPFDLVVSSEGVLVVLDSEQGWLYRFDTNGNSLGRIAGPSAQFFHPRGLSIDAQDNLYVADTGGSRIVKLSLDGQRLQIFGAKGVGKGQFVEPSDGAMDTSGFLFATDVPNKRIEMFNADGKFINDFPIPLAGPFNGPHLAFAPDQTLLVTAPESHKVQRYARDGKLLGEWNNNLRLPTGITVDRNFVWIADTGNHRIQKWEIK